MELSSMRFRGNSRKRRAPTYKRADNCQRQRLVSHADTTLRHFDVLNRVASVLYFVRKLPWPIVEFVQGNLLEQV
jgi:hypothetical protein